MKTCNRCGLDNRDEANYCSACGVSLVEATSDPVTGDSVRLQPGMVVQGRYRVVQQIGESGPGRVFLAQDENGRRYALKQICDLPGASEMDEDSIYLRSFQREAQILSSLPHPYLPIARDFIPGAHSLVIVMDYIEGRTLAEVIDEAGGPLPEQQAVLWAAQVCDALIYLHSKRPPIIHRNIKPKNIILGAGEKPRPRLIGFGLARYYIDGLEKDEDLLGTQGYSPPEQYGLAQTDPRSDIFGLGATLFAMLTDRDPGDFVTLNAPEGMTLGYPDLRQLNSQVSEATCQVVQRALQTDPNQRFQSAVEMKVALETILAPKQEPVLEEIRFAINQAVPLEETRFCEFKEIQGEDPIRAVMRLVNIYVVAFLNSEGGRIFWGIRDDDRCVVGVKLKYRQRDALRRGILDKAMHVQPAVSPSAYRITFHPVYDGEKPIEDLYVLEVFVPRSQTRLLYFTEVGEVYVKTDAGKKKLSGLEIQDEIVRRLHSQGQER